MGILDGRVALVTGGGRGIGRAVAVTLARAGADVAVLARSAGELEQVAAEVGDSGRRGLAVTADVADTGQVQAAVERVASDLGPVDVLVANAGVVWPLGRTWQIDPDDWARALDINVAGVLRCCRAVLPAMVERGGGHVITLSSGAADAPGMPSASAYSASKAAVDLLTKALAKELSGSGVHICGLRPGTVESSMQDFIRQHPADEVGAELHDRFQALKAEGRLVAPDVPARAVLALVASELSGEVIDVRGETGERLEREGAALLER